jgi:hypothetical protein
MPEVALVVCLHGSGRHLERLLTHAQGCYDDLLIVHDGPDETGVRRIGESCGGRFFERPRAFQQERHWPFAWGQARCDWILRWDADEFPSPELRRWLEAFRQSAEPAAEVSGFEGILPLWDGRRALTRRWPRRVILIHRGRVRFFGMPDQGPIADGRFERTDLVLHHQPERKAHGVRYMLRRPKVRRWFELIAEALQGRPTDLPCWRWDSPEWPWRWERIRRRPVATVLSRLVLSPIGNLREMAVCGEIPKPWLVVSFPLQHVMMCLCFMRARRRARAAGGPAA